MSTLPSVMVVDDEEELAYLFKVLLKGSGFDTVSFTDPLLDLDYFGSRSNQYHLILSDFEILGIGKVELVKRIRESCSNVKMLSNNTTAFYDMETLNTKVLRRSNISKVLKKPKKLIEQSAQVNSLWNVCLS